MGSSERRIYFFEGVEVDLSRECLTIDGAEKHLRRKAFQVLECLLEHQNRLVTKDELFETVWGGVAVTDDVLVQCIKEIRRAIGDDPHQPRFIKTVPKSGYRFIGEINSTVGSNLADPPIAKDRASETLTTRASPHAFRFRIQILILSFAAVLAIFCVFYFASTPQTGSTEIRLPEIEGRKSIAVMFFDNQSRNTESEWLREGLADMLIAGLSRSERLTVLSREQLFLLLERHSGKADSISFDRAKELAGRAGAEYFIAGGFAQIGSAIRLDVRLYKTQTGEFEASETLTVERAEQLLSQIDLLSLKLATKLGIGRDENRSVSAVMTDNLEAYRLYSIGVEKAQALHSSDAIESFSEAVKLDPDFAMAQARVGYTYAISAGNVEKGKPYLEKAYQLGSRLTEKDRMSIAAWYAIANLDFPGAIRAYRELIDRYPLETESYVRLARLYRGENRPDEAIEILRRGLAVDPEEENMYNALGGVLSGEGMHAEAIAAHEHYVALAPDEPNAFDSLGLSYQAAGNYDLAVENYEKALAINPNFEISVIHVANTLYRMGRYEKAIEAFKRYIACGPSNSEKSRGYAGIAQTYLSQGNIKKAAESMHTSEKLGTGEPSITGYLILAKSGRTSEAEKLEPRLLHSLTGTERGARANRRFEYFGRGIVSMRKGNVDEAIELFRQVLPSPRPTWHWTDFEDCLANAFLQAGRSEEAIVEYNRIIAAMPNYPLAHFHLAKAYEAKGLNDEARSEYSKFLEVWRDADVDIAEVVSAKAAIGKL